MEDYKDLNIRNFFKLNVCIYQIYIHLYYSKIKTRVHTLRCLAAFLIMIEYIDENQGFTTSNTKTHKQLSIIHERAVKVR